MKHVTDKAWEFKGVHEKMHIHTQHIHVKDCIFICTDLNKAELSPAESASNRGQGC